MKAFAALYAQLDASTSTTAKVAALEHYFRGASPIDAAWAVYFLAGGKPQQLVPTKVLRAAALQASGLSEWLFEESYQAVGDLAETIATILPPPQTASNLGLSDWMTQRLLPLRGKPPEVITAELIQFWASLEIDQRFVLNKLITGGLRVGVSKLLVIRGLAAASGVDKKLLAQRLMGYTDAKTLPTAARYLAIVNASESSSVQELSGQPYPFFLAHQLLLEGQPDPSEKLGDRVDWQVEWKWDGIRAQLIKRGDGPEQHWWLWSRGEELITDRFPDIEPLAKSLPSGTVLDGEVLAWDAENLRPLAFGVLQKRIGRKTISASVLKQAPVIFMAYDLIESQGRDCRMQTMSERRKLLEALSVSNPLLRLSEVVDESESSAGGSWAQLAALRADSRERGVEGFMLKHKASTYGVGRTKADGLWWKWKIDPLTIDCVLIYAQRGHGRRASLYTDYTFAVWHGEQLVPFAKAYSGLTDDEFKKVDDVIRKTTIDKFGPVRSVTPTLVFELGFEGIGASQRHKSGIAVRFPRILRWRTDKQIHEADNLERLRALISL